MPDIGHVSGLIASITGLRLCESTFSFYSNNSVGYDTSFSEEVGFFIPRKLKGCIKLDAAAGENARRTAHEVSHGFYLENTFTGQRIVSGDRRIAETEKSLFGRLLERNEKLLVLTDRGIEGAYPVDEMHKEARKLVPEDINLQKYETVAFVKGRSFADYRNLRASYYSLVSGDIENQEGFCTLMEYRALQQIDPAFAEHVLILSFFRDDVYGRGFRKLKASEAVHGLSAVIDYLMERR